MTQASLSHEVYSSLNADLRERVARWVEREPAHWIGGERRRAAAGGTLPVVDPGTGTAVGEIAAGDAADVAAAVASAQDAFEQWRGLRPSKRAELLMQAAAIVRAHVQELAAIETLDTGKPLRDASGEAWWAADAFQYYAGLAKPSTAGPHERTAG